MQSPILTRRRFLHTSAAAAALYLPAGRAAARPGRRGQDADAPVARNLIFMVSDGMSTGTLTLADMVSRQRDGRASNWVSLWDKPGVRRATAMTCAADSLVTDSAAGGSAWGCGVHVNNGSINITPQGHQRVPLLVQAAQSGKATALVTTARVTHATPASFVANVPSRDMERAIGKQTLERGVDVALGGGAHSFPDALLDQHKGVTVVRDRAALAGAPASGRLLGLFEDQHVPYVLDRADTVPTLPEMTRAALGRVGSRAGGFVMQVEGGRVDHAAHNNDAPSLLAEQLEFDRAIGEVMSYVEGRDDTLVIITTDHGNANPGLTLYGEAGRKGLDRISDAKHSFDWIAEQFSAATRAGSLSATLAEIVMAATGIGLDQAERRLLEPMLSAHPPRTMPFFSANKWTSVLGAILADHFGIAFLSPNHTSDMVEVTALGPGSERLRPMIDNVDLHGLSCGALALAEPTPLPGMDEVVAPVGRPSND